MQNNNESLYSSFIVIIIYGAIVIIAFLVLFFTFGQETKVKILHTTIVLLMLAITYRYWVLIDVYPSFLRIWKPFKREDFSFEHIEHIKETWCPNLWYIKFRSSRHSVYFYTGWGRVTMIKSLEGKVKVIEIL